MILLNGSTDELHQPYLRCGKVPDEDDIALCREALEVLTLAISLHPSCIEGLCKEKSWHQFIIDIVLLCKERSIRSTGADQFLLIATRCTGEQHPIIFFITLLFTVLPTTATDNAPQSAEYYGLLTRLLSFASLSNISLNTAETLLGNEINWLKKLSRQERPEVDENLLEGHLCLCRDLLAFMPPEKKFELGSEEKHGVLLVKDLIENFIFPASKMYTVYKQTDKMHMGEVNPICSTGPTLLGAFELLVALSKGCLQNLTEVSRMLTEMFYTDKEDIITEWEYFPPVGPRPQNGFVGLKNAGATCYMNSVLQQLFTIDSIRTGVLSADGACTDLNEDFSGEDREEVDFVSSGKIGMLFLTGTLLNFLFLIPQAIIRQLRMVIRWMILERRTI